MRQLAILTALAALAACDQQTNQPPANEAESEAITQVDETADGDGAPPDEDASTPADDITNGEMRWNFSRSTRGPKLAFGEPATDSVKLMLRCEGSDRVELSFIRPSSAAGDGDSMIVAAGGAERQLEATVEQTELGPVMVRAVIPISSEPIRNFRSGSGLEVRWRRGTISVPPAGDQGRQLFEACRA